MKRRDKEIIRSIATMVSAMILLLCGALALEIGQEAKAVVLIMCSLYTAMWIHAGIVGTSIHRKFESMKEEAEGGGSKETIGTN